MSGVNLFMATIPNLRPDEILYSWLGCLIRRNALGPWRSAAYSLLGGTKGLVLDLPTGLNHIYQTIGMKAGLRDAEELIERATLYPYHRPFAGPSRDARVRQAMLDGGSKTSVKATLGRLANRFGANPGFRFCRSCVEFDLATRGESYWRRAWLVPGATHCLTHDEVLVIQRRGDRASNPCRAIAVDPSEVLSAARTMHSGATRIYTHLANDLLQASLCCVDPHHLNRVYRGRAQALGYVSPGGSVRLKMLAAHLTEQYENFQGFEHRLRLVAPRGYPPDWLMAIFRRPERGVHPMCHTLLIGFLFETMAAWRKALLQPASAAAAVGRPKSHRERPLDDALIRDAALSCRDVARRTGFSVNTVVSLRLEQGIEVRTRAQSRTRSVAESIAAALADGQCLKTVAASHGVSLSTVCRALRNAPEVRRKRTQRIFEGRQEVARREWSTALQGGSAPKEARAVAPAAYAWLYRNDRDWLRWANQALPSSNPSKRRGRVDWEARDAEISAAVYEVTRNAAAFPQRRASVYGVLRVLRLQATVSKNWQRMPMTFDALMVCTESVREHQERRLELAAMRLLESQARLSISTLMSKARINVSHVGFVRRWFADWYPRHLTGATDIPA